MKFHPRNKKWIVYLSTFPPRECGIATFTQDLMRSFDEMYNPREEAKVVAMNVDEVTHYTYDEKKVIYQIAETDEESYVRAARFLNSLSQVLIVNIQHEFGIFGGNYGNYLLHFLKELKKPTVITFHTVLPGPNPDLRNTVVSINNFVESIIVMTETSKQILIRDYSIDAAKIKVIPHGIHPTEISNGKVAKNNLGLKTKTVISTFGLLGPGKGIEFCIEAMAKVVSNYPNAVFLIIGATHPGILKRDGEAYRNTLIKKVHEFKLEKNIFFYNRYLSLSELLGFLEAADIYLMHPQEPNQAVSGTLSYALGSGKPVVSTPFAQAKEDVTKESGILVDFKNVDQIADALKVLIADPARRLKMGENSYFRMRSRTWPNVMLQYMAEYKRIVPSLDETEKNLPRIKLSHILQMTDDFGMIQFAKITEPDPESGYTADDNARALIAVIRYYEKTGRKNVLPLIQRYLNFLAYVERPEGGFHNYVDIKKNIDPTQHEREFLESTSARSLFALAKAASSKIPEKMREQAKDIFQRHRNIIKKMVSPRSIAYCIKALAAWNEVDSSEEVKKEAAHLADELVRMFNESSAPNWKWFEDILAYSNGVMPDSLIDAYSLTKNETYLKVARESMDFLISNSFDGDICMPIGQSGWLKRGGRKYIHDQQPEEVAVLVFTLKSFYRITGDEIYKKKMIYAFGWFLGNNTLRQVVYNEATGGCYDGVGEKNINLNQGAESTIMYLLARLSFE